MSAATNRRSDPQWHIFEFAQPGTTSTARLRVKASKDQLTNLSRINAAGYEDLIQTEGPLGAATKDDRSHN